MEDAQAQGLPGLELHDPKSSRYVPPHRWCITREDLEFFEKEVRDLYNKGGIPDDPHRPNPRHDDPAIGPTMYQVNKFYIKPKTLEAGGMSWALMRHPEGLECDVFATHAWIEGVFEFTSKVLAAWPSRAKHIYVCFLANPQNGDISELLSGDVFNSPFAEALEKAKHMLVIPNHHSSIYLRLWCVLEAWIAVRGARDRGLAITIPKKFNPTVVFEKVLSGIVLMTCGCIFGYYVAAPVIGNLLGPVMWLLSAYVFLNIIGWIGRNVAHASGSVTKTTTVCLYTAYAELCVAGLSSGLAWWHLHGHAKKGSEWDITEDLHDDKVAGRAFSYQPGSHLPLTILLISLTFLYLYKIVLVIKEDIVEREDRKLDFETVREAACSSPEDKRKIMDAIDGHIEEIDDTIDMLRRVGRFDGAVQHNLEKGMMLLHVREGINPAKITLSCCAWLFWWMADLRAHGYQLIAYAMLLMALLTAFASAYYIGEKTIFAIDAAAFFGIAFVLLSNDDTFFNKDVAKARDMSGSTLWLQASLLAGMVAVDAYFYSGLYARHRAAVVAASCWGPRQDEVDEHVEEAVGHKTSKKNARHRTTCSDAGGDSGALEKTLLMPADALQKVYGGLSPHHLDHP